MKNDKNKRSQNTPWQPKKQPGQIEYAEARNLYSPVQIQEITAYALKAVKSKKSKNLDAIISAIENGGLERCVITAAAFARTRQHLRQRQPPRIRIAIIEEIEASASRLLSAVEQLDSDSEQVIRVALVECIAALAVIGKGEPISPDFLSLAGIPQFTMLLSEIKKSVGALEKYCCIAKYNEEKRDGNNFADVKYALVCDLIEIWESIGLEPTLSYSSKNKENSGYFFNFVTAIARPLNLDSTGVQKKMGDSIGRAITDWKDSKKQQAVQSALLLEQQKAYNRNSLI